MLLIVLFFNCMKNPLLRMSGIAVGLLIGYLIALFWGKVDFSSLNGLPLVTIPVPFKYGFAFDSHAFVVAGAVDSMVDSVLDNPDAMMWIARLREEEYSPKSS